MNGLSFNLSKLGRFLTFGLVYLLISNQSFNAFAQVRTVPNSNRRNTETGEIQKSMFSSTVNNNIVFFDNNLNVLDQCDTTYIVSGDSFIIDLGAATGSDVVVIAGNPSRRSKIAACVQIETPGFYRILTTIRYGDSTQTDETFFLEVTNSIGDTTFPCDPNAGNHNVIVDDEGEVVKTAPRNAGVFYFNSGNHIIQLNHFILIAKNFLQFVNDTTYFVNNDSTFKGPQSVHLNKLTLERTNVNHDLALSKSASKDTVKPKEEFSYNLIIKNIGSTAAYKIELRDEIPDSVTIIQNSFNFDPSKVPSSDVLFWSFDSLAPGDSIKIEYEAKAAGAFQTFPYNLDSFSQVSTPCDTNTANNEAVNTVTVIENSDLELTKSVSRDTTFQGEEFTYTLNIVNHGPRATSEISLWDAMPEYVTLLESTPSPVSIPTSDTLEWKFDSISAGDSLSVQIRAILSDSVDILCSVLEQVNYSWVSSEFDINTTNNRDSSVVYIIGECHDCDIALTKSVNMETVTQGDEFVYTLMIENRGTMPARNITLSDAIPDYIVPSTASLMPLNPVDSDTLFWMIDSLDVGESVDIDITASIPCNLEIPFFPFAQVNNSWVLAECDANDLYNHASVSVYVINACTQNYDLELGKTVNPDTVFQGQEFTYKLKIVNHGPRTANSFELWDAVPDFITPQTFTMVPVNSISADTLRWEFESLAQNDSIIIEFKAMIPASLVLPESPFSIKNTSLVEAEYDTNAQNNFGSSTVVCLLQPQNDCIVLNQNVFEPDKGVPLALTFELDSNSLVSMNLYDICGHYITELVERDYNKGEHTYFWDGMTEKGLKVGSGVYIIIFSSSKFNCIEKVIVAL